MWDGLLALAALLSAVWLLRFVHTDVGWAEVGQVLVLGLINSARVLVLITLAALLWVPVGVWVGLNPLWAGRLQAQGLGSYIARMTAVGDFPRIALGIGVMCVFVMALNHLVWRPLYRLAERAG